MKLKSSPALALLLAAGLAGASLLAGGGPAVASTATAGALSVSALSFTSTANPVAAGSAVTLDFTIADSNNASTGIGGDVYISQETAPDKFVGVPVDVQFAYQSNIYQGAAYVSGTPQDSSYTFSFLVPRYAAAATTVWAVSEVSAQDGTGATLTAQCKALARFHPAVKATGETVDTTAPTYNLLQVAPIYPSTLPYTYDNGVSGLLSYSLQIEQDDSGFWKGSLGLTGPGAATMTIPFYVTASQNQFGGGDCNDFGADVEFVSCDPLASLPAGSPAGTWYVTSVTLTSNAGTSMTYGGLQAAPITVTSDSTVSASNFSVSPNPADNWTGAATVEVSMDVAGAQGGISAVYVDAGNICFQRSTTPTVNADGSISIPLFFGESNPSCQVDGIAIVDGVGNVALYGTEYNAPDPGLTITREPDTVAPTVTSAGLSFTTIAQNQIGDRFLDVDATVNAPIAPVSSFSTTVYDSTGTPVPGDEEFGGVSEGADGTVLLGVGLPYGMAPGTYTVGFSVTDAGGLTTSYGPGGQPVPGGPLTFTVTASS
jgi:hypothetical protein